MRTSTPFPFQNDRGQALSGILDMPTVAPPLFFGVFAPCFTCVKESHGAAKVCREMAERGAAMLRFDMAGLGQSEGDIADMNFTTRIGDIMAVCAALEAAHGAPALLVGHSISGTATLSAAQHLPSLQAVATIGAPCDTVRTVNKFRQNNLVTEKDDMLEISVLGKPVLFKKTFESDMLSYKVEEDTAQIDKKLFIFHAPHDNIVAFENADIIRARAVNARDPEIIRLDDDATHLFENRRDDAAFVAATLMEWFRVHLKGY